MTDYPTLSIGLPVYNGERYLAEALTSLLASTFTDFELIISDNASTDRTAQIATSYAGRDPRIHYLRQPTNIGAAPNHNAVFTESRGRYFTWASYDDLYAPELFRLCIEALESRPEIVLAHAWDAFIDQEGEVIRPVPYELDTANPRPSLRFKSLLHGFGGNDFYGVVRAEAFARVGPLGSHHHADRTFVAALALQGAFYQVPEVLYFRRDHPARGERAPGRRARSANLDPRRADRLRNPMLRLLAEYVGAYVVAIARAPLTPAERVSCLAALGAWLVAHVRPNTTTRLLTSADPALLDRAAPAVPPSSTPTTRRLAS